MTYPTLADLLPSVMPAAIAWAQETARHIEQHGLPLNQAGACIAQRVGVRQIERVRILEVDIMPMPDALELRQLARAADFYGPDTHGLTLGHGILLVKGRTTATLIAHELRHVHQYEQAGSIADFLPAYLMDVANKGYEHSAFEIDARSFEAAGHGPY